VVRHLPVRQRRRGALSPRADRRRFSNNEYFGALIASVVAEKLGLPGNDPRVVLTAQHKFYARKAYAATAPEAGARFAAFPYSIGGRDEFPFDFPCFVKPVKATFSVLAGASRPFSPSAICASGRSRNTSSGWSGRSTTCCPGILTASTLNMTRKRSSGVQVNLDGYVHADKVAVLGVIDEHMYPGTYAFRSFEYPSRVPAATQARMVELAAKILNGIGYRHGFFNMELAWEPETGRIRLIEINPRMASQLACFYEWVDGVSPYDALFALACGEAPRLQRAVPIYRHAASFALRKFDGKPLRSHPTRAQLERVRRDYPDARLMLYLKRGAALAREMKWLGSYRYAVVNMGGGSIDDLQQRFHALRRALFLEADLAS
jgi:hypothetical protein